MEGSLARNARFEIPICLVSILWFSCSVAVSTGSMSFCVAGVAGRDILTCLQMVSKVVLCDRRNPAARFSEYGFPFSWHVQHFGRVHVHFAWQAQHFRRVVLP